MLNWIGTTFNRSYNAFQTVKNALVPESSVMLPDNLSGRILDLQFQCEEETATTDKINTLISLYTEAVEYYEEMNNNKYKIYKKRMEQFMKKSIIEEVLNGKQPILVSKRSQVDRMLNLQRKKSRSEVVKIMGEFDKSCVFSKQIISSNLMQQQTSLDLRIQKRKTMSNRSIYSECESYEEENEENTQPRRKAPMTDRVMNEAFDYGDSSRRRVFI